MRMIRATARFKRDARLAQRRGRDISKLWAIVERLASAQPLDSRNRAHRLSGEFSGVWECHIEPDWLLLWEETDIAVVLIRTGTHSDLFG